jgi:excisionase family DNA binding protein
LQVGTVRPSGTAGAGAGGRCPSTGRAFPTLVDIAGIAALLGVDVRFVRWLVTERHIPYVKVGRYVRFDVAEVAGWLDRQRVREEPGTAPWVGR